MMTKIAAQIKEKTALSRHIDDSNNETDLFARPPENDSDSDDKDD